MRPAGEKPSAGKSTKIRLLCILVEAKGQKAGQKQHLEMKNKEGSKAAHAKSLLHSLQGHRDCLLGKLSSSQTFRFVLFYGCSLQSSSQGETEGSQAPEAMTFGPRQHQLTAWSTLCVQLGR